MNERVTDLQDILKARPNIEELAGMFLLCTDATGMLKKSNAMLLQISSGLYSGDLNEVQGYGIYRLANDGANWPVTAGGMIMLHLNTYQLVFRAGEGGRLYFRAKSDARGWGAWKTVV